MTKSIICFWSFFEFYRIEDKQNGNYKVKQYVVSGRNLSSKVDTSKFELESLDFDSAGKLYVFMNVDGHGDSLYVSKTPIN